MALSPLPPWLQVSPQQFIEARKAGAGAGLGIAQLNQRATEAANEQMARDAALAARAEENAKEQAFRRWELEMNLQNKAAAQAAEQAQAAATLDETKRFRLDQGAIEREKLAEQRAYHEGSIEADQKRAEAALIRAGKTPLNMLTPYQAMQILNDPYQMVDYDDTYGKGTRQRLIEIARQGVGLAETNPKAGVGTSGWEPPPGAVIPSAGTSVPMTGTHIVPQGITPRSAGVPPPPSAKTVPIDAARRAAKAMIDPRYPDSKDAEAVRARFKQLYGEDL